MTLGAWLHSSEKTLRSQSGTARLDVEVIASSVLMQSRAWLLSHHDYDITSSEIKTLNAFLSRRVRHEPIAYIIGEQEFFKRKFVVDHHVLVPRPESETMIELALKHQKRLIDNATPQIADIGSGSGALGITLALEMNLTSADFVDIDTTTFEVAKNNAMNHGINGQYYESDLLESVTGPYDILLANLPYVPDTHTINSAAMTEPRSAIFGGRDGLDLYRRLFNQLKDSTWSPRLLLTESLPPQHDELLGIATASGYHLLDEQDFVQVFVP